MTYKAKKTFLRFKEGEQIEKVEKNWLDEKLVELIGEEVKEKPLSVKNKSRIKDFVEDIMDDGKRNRSNRKKKKKVN